MAGDCASPDITCRAVSCPRGAGGGRGRVACIPPARFPLGKDEIGKSKVGLPYQTIYSSLLMPVASKTNYSPALSHISKAEYRCVDRSASGQPEQ